jgi:hypothetical protein
MTLTPELKAEIDGMSVYVLLEKNRFSSIGDPLFQGESGEYCLKRLRELKDKDPEGFTSASKHMGW